jgi:hypothetical protein
LSERRLSPHQAALLLIEECKPGSPRNQPDPTNQDGTTNARAARS